MKRFVLFLMTPLMLISCATPNSSESEGTDFEYWNACDSLTALKSFVSASVDEKNENYIKKEDRLAVFDMDGTLYGELYPTYFEYVMYEYRVLEDPSYKDKATEEQILLANEIKAGVMKDSEGNDVVT
ncbi:MAG: hypothetical protein K6F32_00925, partial [Bacilli bacterium]|nr:hypothetical protein [Bacilli bacterium]